MVYTYADSLNYVIAKICYPACYVGLPCGSQDQAFNATSPDPLNQEDGDEKEETFLDKSLTLRLPACYAFSIWNPEHIAALQYLSGGYKKDGVWRSTVDYGRTFRHNGCDLKQERFRLNVGKNLLHEESQAFEQVAKRDCTVSILGGLPNPTG